MTTLTREAALNALFALLQNVSGVNYFSRRFSMWDNVPAYPAILLTEKPENMVRGKQLIPAIRTLNAEIWIYTNTGLNPNATIIPATVQNNLIDAIDPNAGGVLRPTDHGKLTLSGLVTDCYIEGDIHKIPGDIDGKGIALINTKITLMQP